jgi:hypothetical protein
MSATFNATTVQGILKRYFKNSAVQNTIASKMSAIWKAMKKSSDGGGDFCSFTQVLSDPFTVSQDFAQGQTYATTSTVSPGLKFNMPWQELSAPVRVSAKANLLTATNKVAWFKAIGLAAAGALRMMNHVLSINALASGFGELASSGITYGGSGASFTVANGAINHFVQGMGIVGADTLDSATLRSPTPIYVTDVNYSTSTVTCGTALTTPGILDGDFVFLAGNRQNSATPVRLQPVGLRHWLPEVRPVVDTNIITLEGTLRSGTDRAYGQFVDGMGQDDLDALIELAQSCVIIGNATKLTAYVSHRRYVEMAKALSSDRRFTDTTGNSGFFKLSVAASEISVNIEIDRNAEDDVGYMLQDGAYEAIGAGEIPHIQDNGGQWVRVSDDNSSELRAYAVYAQVMNDPAACGVTLFAPLS